MRLIGRIFLYLLAGMGAVSLLVLVGVTIFAITVQDDEPVPDQVVLALDIGSGIIEQPSGQLLDGLGKSGGLILQDIIGALAAAKADERVKGVVLDIGEGGVAIAHAQAVRRAVLDFRKSGKFVYSFAESYGGLGNGTVSYYLASSADKVFIQPSGTVGVVGLAIEAPFIADTLGKLDVEARYEQRHEYKGAGEMFIRRGFSPQARESLSGLITSWMDQMIVDIGAARNLTPQAVKDIIETSPLLAEEAKTVGLVDGLAYRDIFETLVAERAGDDTQWVGLAHYQILMPEPPSAITRVALIYGSGTIVPGRGDASPLAKSRQFGAERIVEAIRDAVDDPSVSAIVLRIDSPGGAYGASDTVWREIHAAREAGKPVIASLGQTAASGGYFVAMAADKIIAEAGTVTGSIGVFTVKFITRDFWRKLGIEWDRVQSGPRAAMWSMIDDYPEGGAARMGAILDAIYADFTIKAATARGLNQTQIDQVARGRVWSGQAAKEVGLVDEIGGLETAFDAVRNQLELPTDEPLEVLALPRPTKLEALLSELRRQGLDVSAGVAQVLATFVPGTVAGFDPLLQNFELMAPPVGVLQMPAWRLAK